MTKLEAVSVNPKANVYFDGRCVSHSITMPDGSSKSAGVILPSELTFNTGAPEIMEVVEGECQVTLAGESQPTTYRAGEQFNVPGNSSFVIKVDAPLHYICHFG